MKTATINVIPLESLIERMKRGERLMVAEGLAPRGMAIPYGEGFLLHPDDLKRLLSSPEIDQREADPPLRPTLTTSSPTKGQPQQSASFTKSVTSGINKESK